MKTNFKHLGAVLLLILTTSCGSDDFVEVEPGINLNQLLASQELWYVDINRTVGLGEVPFLQIAFTLSFNNGVVFANNNLVNIGVEGNGFGIAVGEYDAYDMILDVFHDIDGFQTFDVFQLESNLIELYNPDTDTSYFLEGYQRSNFDYDFVFYDNIQYFLQEYEAWEKTFTSQTGNLNDFDNENYLQFLPENNNQTFRSSKDIPVVAPNNIIWDFTGLYNVSDVANTQTLKRLRLRYDFFDENEFFELSVINDAEIELFHPSSQTVYVFQGIGQLQFLRNSATKAVKKRIETAIRKANPRVKTR